MVWMLFLVLLFVALIHGGAHVNHHHHCHHHDTVDKFNGPAKYYVFLEKFLIYFATTQ